MTILADLLMIIPQATLWEILLTCPYARPPMA
jgi:hypothetical protein